MRDVIWTIIIIWLIYKVIDMFKSSHQKKAEGTKFSFQNQKNSNEKEARKSTSKHSDKEGEYVDFEEIK